MTDTTELDTVQRENAELRDENARLQEGLIEAIRENAAVAAGLEPHAGRWVKGDTPEEARADALKLASQMNGSPPSPPSPAPSPEARAIQQHSQEKRDAFAANADQTQED